MESRQPKPGKSLAERNPLLAAQLHPTKNGQLTALNVMPASHKKVWWLCPEDSCRHEWSSDVKNRTQGTGCPDCGKKSSGKSRSIPAKGQSLEDINPKLANEWHPNKNGKLTPAEVKPWANFKVWWLCQENSCGHEWQSMVNNRSNGRGCPECGKKLISLSKSKPGPGESLAEVYPALLKEWHPTLNGHLTPTNIKPGSDLKTWWHCQKPSCEYVWEARVYSRSNGNGCPKCGGKSSGESRMKPAKGQSLADINPKLANEWNTKKNGGLTPFDVKMGSSQQVWWRCSITTCGHEWLARISSRKLQGCPECGKKSTGESRSRPAKGQSLGDVNPRLANEWNTNKNGSLTPYDVKAGSTEKVWWCCSNITCGNEWLAMISNRSNGRGCPSCSKSGYKTNKPGSLYVSMVTFYETWGAQTLIKFGISNDVNKRIADERRSSGGVHEILFTYSHGSGHFAQELERAINVHFGVGSKSKSNAARKNGYKFDGSDETIESAKLGELTLFIENWIASSRWKRGVDSLPTTDPPTADEYKVA